MSEDKVDKERRDWLALLGGFGATIGLSALAGCADSGAQPAPAPASGVSSALSGSNAVMWFDTIGRSGCPGDLRGAYVSGTAIAIVKGFHTPGDGGGGIFYWDSASTAADDGGTIIQPGDPAGCSDAGVDSGTGAGRWIRIYTIGKYNVRWFGAGTGAFADDAVPINAVIALALSGARNPFFRGSGCTIEVPNGIYTILTSIVFSQGYGMIFRGTGPGDTVFSWANTADSTSPMFLVTNMNSSTFQDFMIYVSPTTLPSLAEAIRITFSDTVGLADGGTGAPSPDSSSNVFRNIKVSGNLNGSTPCIGYGFRVTVGTNATEINNDFHFFDSCVVKLVGTAGWSLDGGQAKKITMLNCQVASSSNYGVKCLSSSFNWIGGSIVGSGVADFYVDNNYDAVLIQGSAHESSAQFLNIPNFSGGAVVAVDNCRIMANAATGPVISMSSPGPLVLRSNNFGGGTSAPYMTTPGSSYRAAIVCEGNYFPFADTSGHGSALTDFFSNTPIGNIHVAGNLFNDPNTAPGVPTASDPNFKRTNAPYLAVNDATPNVFTSDLFYTSNTSTTSYTNFLGAFEGKRITIVVNDAHTSFTPGTTLKLSGGASWSPTAGSTITLVYDANGSCWREVGRMAA